MNLASEIKMIRQRAFMTQKVFAEMLDVSFSTVNRWENGKSLPNISTMKQIKIFCENNNISFDNLEKAWLYGSREEK